MVLPVCDGTTDQRRFPRHARAEQSALGREGVVDIGAPERTYTAEPIEDPVPREIPDSPEPCEPEREPEPQTVESG